MARQSNTEKMIAERKKAEAERTDALNNAIFQIEKKFGKGSVMRLGDNEEDINVETISTGCLSLDRALGLGGVPRGRVIEIYGPESSGKTTVALHMVAEVQRTGGIAGFIDAEHALDPAYAKKSVWTLIIFIFHSQIMENRRLRLPKQWCVPALLIS